MCNIPRFISTVVVRIKCGNVIEMNIEVCKLYNEVTICGCTNTNCVINHKLKDTFNIEMQSGNICIRDGAKNHFTKTTQI